MAAAKTIPCPGCDAAIPMPRATGVGACPACGLRVRFLDVPDMPCQRCGALVPVPPGKEEVRCPECGRAHASAAGRPVQARARCPRCSRRIPVGLDDRDAVCPHCGQRMALADRL